MRRLLHEIRELLAAPKPQATEARPLLERVDATLTAGYARALQLEAERWRLERRLGEVAAHIAHAPDPQTDELALLARKLTEANEEIQSLRALLGSLRERRSDLNQAA